MSAVHHSIVTLRIYGDGLVPQDITKMLGAPSTRVKIKDASVGSKTGKIKPPMWRFIASDREPEDIDGQIQEIFGQLSTDVSVWQSITKKYHVNLSCGLFMSKTNDGLSISPQSLVTLTERGIELWFDIYAPLRDVAPTNLCPCNSGKTYAECCAPKTSASIQR
jgi:hypothetical protein